MDWGTCMCVNLDMQTAIRQEPRAPPSPPQAFSCLEGDSCPCAPSTSFTHISVSSSRTSSWIWHKFSGESGRATTACSPRSLLSPSPTLTISSPFLCDCVVWKIHLASFPSDNDLLNCEFLGFIFKAHLHEISTPACFCISALPGCYSTSLKTAIIFQRQVGVDPVPLPFHSFLLINPLMGQIFSFCVGFVAVTNLHTIGCKNTAIPKFSTSIFLSFSRLAAFTNLSCTFALFFSTWQKHPNNCSQKCDETTDRWVDLANPLPLSAAPVEVLKCDIGFGK